MPVSFKFCMIDGICGHYLLQRIHEHDETTQHPLEAEEHWMGRNFNKNGVGRKIDGLDMR